MKKRDEINQRIKNTVSAHYPQLQKYGRELQNSNRQEITRPGLYTDLKERTGSTVVDVFDQYIKILEGLNFIKYSKWDDAWVINHTVVGA